MSNDALRLLFDLGADATGAIRAFVVVAAVAVSANSCDFDIQVVHMRCWQRHLFSCCRMTIAENK